MRIIIPLGIVALGLMIYSAVECLQTPRQRVRVLGKWTWFAVILLVPLIGAGLWLAFGRARKESDQAQQRRPAAPDDDPNFLRGLEIQRRQRQRQQEQRRQDSQGHGAAAASADQRGSGQTRGEGGEQPEAEHAGEVSDSGESAEAPEELDPNDPRLDGLDGNTADGSTTGVDTGEGDTLDRGTLDGDSRPDDPDSDDGPSPR